MGMIGRLGRAFGAFTERSRIGALQGGLIFNLKNSGVDSPRTKQFIAQIPLAAWKIPIVSEFFANLGFTYADYEIMYHAAVIACPNILIDDKNLVATFLMIDNCHKFEPALQAIAEAVSEKIGDERKTNLSNSVTLIANDIAKSIARS
jgi:hypothetical protein